MSVVCGGEREGGHEERNGRVNKKGRGRVAEREWKEEGRRNQEE